MYYAASNGVKTVVILRDTDTISPRDPDYQDNITYMICWHRRYSLGDQHDYKTPDAFAEAMVSKYVSNNDFFRGIQDGLFESLRLKETDDGYIIQAKNMFSKDPNNWEADSHEPYSLSKDLNLSEESDPEMVREDLMSYCSSSELLRLCEQSGQVAILPLYLYDHSGISMSTGSFIGRVPHADWDSSQVGYIYLDKETAVENLCMAGEKVRIAKPIPYPLQESHIIPQGDFDSPVDSAMAAAGYSPVSPDSIMNLYDASLSSVPNQPLIDPNSLEKGLIFKKDNALYEFECWNPDGTFTIQEIATYNPDLVPLSEDTWKSRAEEILKADVIEYDNYLRDDIYGYQIYEGLEEVESVWGFNPGRERIQDVIGKELRHWFGSSMDFESDFSSDNFDIDSYFEDHDFPQLREDIRNKVQEQLEEDYVSVNSFPYATSYDDIKANKDNILDDIVEKLYSAHLDPTSESIKDTIFTHAGISRTLKAKITVADLEPGRDYTSDEIMAIFGKKQHSLQDMIASASSKRNVQVPASSRETDRSR